MTAELLVAVPLAVPVLLFAILHLEWFVSIGVLGSIFFPASLAQPGGFNVDSGDVVLLVAIVAWIINFGVGRAPMPGLQNRRYYIAAVLFWGVNFVSFAWSVHKSATLGFCVQLGELLFAYPIVMSALPTSLRNLRFGGYSLLAITCGLSLVTIAVLGSGGGSIASGTSVAGFGKNPMGSFTAAGAVYALAQLFSPHTRRGRELLVIITVVDILGTLATGSRGALLGMVGALLVVVLLLGHGGATRIVLALMVTGFIGGVYIFVIAPQKQAALTGSGSYSSASLRIQTWDYAIKQIGMRPWLGTGARTFEEQIVGGALPDPNNLFLLTWAEVGIPGMLTLIGLLAAMVALFRRIRSLPPPFLSLGAGAAGIIISLLLHFQVDVSWSRGESTLVYAMVGFILCLFRLAEEAPLASERDLTQSAQASAAPSPALAPVWAS